MKCFFLGALGVIVILALAAVAVPQYSDYRARAETYSWLAQLEPVQQAIEASAIKRGTFVGISKDIKTPAFSQNNVLVFKVTDLGEIVIKGGHDGQLLILSPSFSEGKVTWHCIGGPNEDMPRRCKT